ncbi:MAG: hypothetical protein DMG83_20395 [Acidobacteria bacterium]|nr:MAG: hypothetical protein DMG83_20395 [Acidobacteriota bacterium]
MDTKRGQTLATDRKERDGSTNVSEIELHSVLKDEWPNVLKWLKNFDLLRCAGLEKLTLHS